MNADNLNEFQADLQQDLDAENQHEMLQGAFTTKTRSIADDIETLVAFTQAVAAEDSNLDAAARVEAWLSTYRPVTEF